MSLLRSIFTGKRIKVPKVIKETLVDGEKTLHSVQQARLRQLIAPDAIFVTNRRIIVHRPYLFGLKRGIEDYKYKDMGNTSIDQGIISSSVKVKMRFLSNDIVLRSIPKRAARDIFKTVQENIVGMSPIDAGSKTKVEKVVICPKCDGENDADANFCNSCGKRLKG